MLDAFLFYNVREEFLRVLNVEVASLTFVWKTIGNEGLPKIFPERDQNVLVFKD